MQTTREKKKYKLLIPLTKYWPIVQLNKERKVFIQRIAQESYACILEDKNTTATLRRLLESTIYKEKARVIRYNWKVDRLQKEGAFWKECERLLFLPAIDDTAERQRCENLLKRITEHYAHEMMSKFRRGHYRFARQMMISLFTRLLNAAHMPLWGLLRGRRLHLSDKIQAIGEIEHVRKLAKRGILVILPTHFSHIDPVVVGWMTRQIGLPPLMYGAGINLFNMRFFAYFMHRVGAYKIDRRKKNPIYLETLKNFTKGIIKYGCHSLFFPGGTRSRTGSMETKLKLGLLNTAVTAQREFYEENTKNKPKKVFIIPVVTNYHFVLEAPSLIRNHLREAGKDRYYDEQDEYSTSYKIFRFLFTFFTRGSNISISLGRGLDVLGNYVNDKGESLDKQGRIIDMKDYFSLHDKVVADLQREQEYTRTLAKQIVKEFHRHNQVLSSHMVAFTAFKIIQQKHTQLDLYNLLRLPEADISIPYAHFEAAITKLQARIHVLETEGQLQYEEVIGKTPADIIKEGIAYCGMYHAMRPLIYRRNSHDIGTQDLMRLYYYHNRLRGYAFEDLF